MIEINITEKAKKRLLKDLTQSSEKYVRLVYRGITWKGSKLDVTLDELRAGDAEILTDGIHIIFNKKEKLYVHKSTIDCDDTSNDDCLVVLPWFKGFGFCWVN